MGAKILIPEGVHESRTIWENTPKNNAKAISIYEKSAFGIMNKLRKNTKRKIIRSFLFKNKKLMRAVNITINQY